MRIGYACLTIGSNEVSYKTCRIKNATSDNLKAIIAHNLNSLDKAIDYNYANNIKLFRISSDIIPFGSNEKVIINWKQIFSTELKKIGEKIKNYQIRVSMHPGQYTIINSPNEIVVKNAISDLKYHCDFLDSIEADWTSKIILHIGGIYGDKDLAVKRFIDNYQKIDARIKKRLVIENDDRLYNIKDVLKLSKIINIPVVYDNLHNKVNNYDESKSDLYWIKKCSTTWKKEDGVQKIHYSEQDPEKKSGSHSSTISESEFLKFYKKINSINIDIMLEVKDKDLSTIKCIKMIKDNNL